MRPLLADGVGGAGWLLPVSGFHATMGGRIHQPEAANRKDLTELTIGVSAHRPSFCPRTVAKSTSEGLKHGSSVSALVTMEPTLCTRLLLLSH